MKRGTIVARKPEARPKLPAENSSKNSKPREYNFKPGNPWRWKPGQSGNPGGRPKSHKELETFIQAIFNESIGVGDHPDWSRLKLMLRGMMTSKSAADHAIVLEHAYGKVAQPFTVEPSEAALKLMEQLGLTLEDVKQDAIVSDFFRAAGVDLGGDSEATRADRRGEASAVIDATSATQDAA